MGLVGLNKYLVEAHEALIAYPAGVEENVAFVDMWRRLGSPTDVMFAIGAARGRGMPDEEANRLKARSIAWFKGQKAARQSKALQYCSPLERQLLSLELSLPQFGAGDLEDLDSVGTWKAAERLQALAFCGQFLAGSESAQAELRRFIDHLIQDTAIADYVGWAFLSSNYIAAFNRLTGALRDNHPAYFGTPFLECCAALQNKDNRRAEDLALETLELQSYHWWAARTVYRLRLKNRQWRTCFTPIANLYAGQWKMKITPEGM